MAFIFLAALAAQAPAAPLAPPPPACAAPEHRQFDFWVGRWDVYPTGSERLVAHSLIERLYGDCVIRESWMPLRGGGGTSLNAWRPASGAGASSGPIRRIAGPNFRAGGRARRWCWSRARAGRDRG